MNAPSSFELPNRLTHAEAMGVLDALTAALAAGSRSVNLAALDEFDSSALAVLLAARRAFAGPAAIRLANAPEKLRRLAGLYGVEGLIFDDA